MQDKGGLWRLNNTSYCFQAKPSGPVCAFVLVGQRPDDAVPAEDGRHCAICGLRQPVGGMAAS